MTANTEIQAMIETWGSMLWQIGLIYLTAMGLIMTNFLDSGIWNWNILIYATVLDVLPVTKAWIQGKANKTMNEMKNMFQLEREVWTKDRDSLKDEIQAYKIKVGIFEAEKALKNPL
jgi:hypothetical protein